MDADERVNKMGQGQTSQGHLESKRGPEIKKGQL